MLNLFQHLAIRCKVLNVKKYFPLLGEGLSEMVIRNIFLPLLWKDKSMGSDVISKNLYPKKRYNLNMSYGTATFPPVPSLIRERKLDNIPSLNRKCKAAFTLAEVLITLGIIGIVAVLTLSIVIQNIQNKQNIAKWKKEYSVINNVFNEVAADGITICNYTKYGDCNGQSYTNEFISSFQSKLKIIDYCGIKTPDVPSEKICDYYNSSWYEKNAKYRWSGVANIYSRYKALGVRIESNPGSYSPYGIRNIKTGKHYLQPMGAEGTYDKAANGEVCECSPDKGKKTAIYIGTAAGQTGEVISGACCSAKYLME